MLGMNMNNTLNEILKRINKILLKENTQEVNRVSLGVYSGELNTGTQQILPSSSSHSSLLRGRQSG